MTGTPAAGFAGVHSALADSHVPDIVQALDTRQQTLSPAHDEIGAPSDDLSCKVVSLAPRDRAPSSQRRQGFQAQAVQSPQCAEPTPISQLSGHPVYPLRTESSAGMPRKVKQSVVLLCRLASLQLSPSSVVPQRGANTNAPKPKLFRKARRNSADIPAILTKTWRSLKRPEKVCLVMAAIEREGGEAVSLNFGIPRQLSCQRLKDPRRAFEKALSKQLGLVGLACLNIVMTLEVTPEASGTQSRVHAHGAVATAALTEDQREGLRTALCKAASIAVGAIGGDRQLVMKPMTCASGWMDYCLDDQAKTRKALGIDNLWVMTREAQRAAKTLHAECSRVGARKAA